MSEFAVGVAAGVSVAGAVALVLGIAIGCAISRPRPLQPFDPTCKHRMESAPKRGWYGRRVCSKCKGEC